MRFRIEQRVSGGLTGETWVTVRRCQTQLDATAAIVGLVHYRRIRRADLRVVEDKA